MKRKPLTTVQLSGYNLKNNPCRTAGLVAVAVILSFTLFGGSLLSASLRNGLESLSERLGVDLAVVPVEHEDDYEGIILSGEPARFYFEKSVQERIKKLDGVAQVSSQFFITTLSAACCTVPVQVIGFDPDTDFITKPWIAKVYDSDIDDGELIIGSDILPGDDGTMKFFNNTYKVIAQLEKHQRVWTTPYTRI